MGKYKKGILGNFRGKVGTVVGSIWNGVHYLRSLGDYTDNPTTAQLNARAKVSLVMPFLAEIKTLINQGWASREKKGLTAMNAASSHHLKNAVSGVGPLYTINYPQVVFSVGGLDGVELPDVATGAGLSIDFTWTPQTTFMGGGSATDKATMLLYCPLEDKFVYSIGLIARSAGEYNMLVPSLFSGNMVHAWIGFVSADGKLVSDSAYIGAVPVA